MKKEVWKVIPECSDYHISNLGNIISFRKNPNGTLLKGFVNCGYKRVSLINNNGIKITKYIHVLVANAFVINFYNRKYVNHIDENKMNNCSDNLEWCSHIYNCNYGTKTSRQRLKMINGKTSKKVYQFNKNGKFIKEFPSLSEAGRCGFQIQNISKCCLNKRKTHKGFIWKYKK